MYLRFETSNTMITDLLIVITMPSDLLELTLTIGVIAASVNLLYFLSARLSRPEPSCLKYASQRKELFSRLRARLRSTFSGLKCLDIGYEEV